MSNYLAALALVSAALIGFAYERPGVANLDPDLRGALRQAQTDAARDRVEIVLKSGWRSPKDQEQLFHEAVSKYGSKKEAARWVATANTSSHVSGDAVDIGPFPAMAWLSKHGAAYGLCQIYRNEPWHYELRPEAIDDGCPSMYADAAQNPRVRQEFDVVSIRRCKRDPLSPPGAPGAPRGENSSPGRLRTGCTSMVGLINDAYVGYADGRLKIDSVPVDGGPAWLDSDFYEINATADGAPGVPMMLGPMMQVLLEDRFQLKVHRQANEGAVYFLGTARGGPKLQPFTEGSCVPYATPQPPLQPGQRVCRTNLIRPSSPAVMQSQGTTLDEFSRLLRMVLGRPVINRTGITGRFDIRIEFSMEGTRLADLDGPPPPSDPAGPPSIFTALQEQLGLRLESGRGPVEMLVIDRIERPTEN